MYPTAGEYKDSRQFRAKEIGRREALWRVSLPRASVVILHKGILAEIRRRRFTNERCLESFLQRDVVVRNRSIGYLLTNLVP